MSDQNWHVVLQGKGQGPFPLATVQTMIKEGKVSKEALVWTSTMANWTCWREVPAFAFLATAEKPVEKPLEAISQNPMQGNQPQSPAPSNPSLKNPLDMVPTNVRDYLSFKRMITPKLVNIFFWIGTIISVVIGLGLFIVSLASIHSQGILIGFLTMLLGPLVIRIYCELMVVFFRINETLTDILHTLEQKK
ncbi:MAG: hypothetical protein RIR22_1424 [Planctomycetota bacterium]|jgi:hypothetical protein